MPRLSHHQSSLKEGSHHLRPEHYSGKPYFYVFFIFFLVFSCCNKVWKPIEFLKVATVLKKLHQEGANIFSCFSFTPFHLLCKLSTYFATSISYVIRAPALYTVKSVTFGLWERKVDVPCHDCNMWYNFLLIFLNFSQPLAVRAILPLQLLG